MLAYLIIGVALGSIYAIAAASLVVTYTSSGILNFAFGSMAFFVAKFFFWTTQIHGVNLAASAILALLVVAPVLGVFLYLTVFRFLRTKSALVNIVGTIGISVALPALAIVLFGNDTINQAPGLAPQPVKYWQVGGTSIDMNQIIIFAFLILVVGVGVAVLRFSDVGLKVRAMVNSEALTSLSGANPDRLALGVWAVTGFLAGAVGILSGPTIGVTVEAMTLLMASAFAAVVAARLRRLGMAVLIAMLMGIVTDVVQFWLPTDSDLTSYVVQSVPFVLMLVVLVFYLMRDGAAMDAGPRVAGHALDAAIKVQGIERAHVTESTSGRSWRSPGTLIALIPMAIVIVLPALADGFWLGIITRGLALALVLLAFSLVTGDGGMLWLCMTTFAGGGAIIAAELNYTHGISPLLGALIGAVAMVPVSLFIGILTIRLGDLYVALVTLTFALLVEKVVFYRPEFAAGIGGVAVERPSFLEEDRTFAYFVLIVFFIVGLVIVNMRRSTVGMAISAVRWSEPAARTLGLEAVRIKLMLTGFAAFVAGLGGAILSMYDGNTDLSTYGPFVGLIWLAVLVTIGVRSLTAALIAGLVFMVLPGVFSVYLSSSPIWLQVPYLLFGLGAVGLALHPQGIVTFYGNALRHLFLRVGDLARSRSHDTRSTGARTSGTSADAELLAAAAPAATRPSGERGDA